MLPRGHIPSLDGLRAVSILLVTACHILPRHGTFLPDWLRELTIHGNRGVDVFFVVSGFLITHLLLREHEKAGNISLRKFYLRRFLRLAPAYYAYLLVVLMIGAVGLGAMMPPVAWLAAVTYTVNILPHPYPGWIGMCWSLAVEEQFYFLWPSILVLAGPRRAWICALGFVVVCPALRFLLWENRHLHHLDIDEFILTRMDTLAVGCLLAYLARTTAADRSAARLAPYASLLCILAGGIVLLSAAVLTRSGKYALGPSRFVEASAIALIVFLAVTNHRSLVGRFLNWGPLVYVGVLSYSLYLAQGFLNPDYPWPFGIWVNIGLMVGYTFASYYLIERPFLRLKERWS